MWTMTFRRFVMSSPSRRDVELFALPGEQNEVAVRITHDEGSSTPRLAPERLNKFDACRLIFEKERLRIIERNRSGKQLLRVASDGVNDPIVDAQGSIARHPGTPARRMVARHS